MPPPTGKPAPSSPLETSLVKLLRKAYEHWGAGKDDCFRRLDDWRPRNGRGGLLKRIPAFLPYAVDWLVSVQ
jgi:hypothetical protein